MMRSKLTILFTYLLVSFSTINAQQEISTSLDAILTKAAKNNFTNKISDEDLNAAKAAYNQTKSVFLPNINVSYSGIATTNPLMAFGSKLNQGILTAADFNPDLLNDPDNTTNFATKFEIEQPIFNMDGFHMRKAARSKMNAVELQSLRTKDYMALEVTKAYMQLQLAYKAVEVLETAKAAALANKKIADNNFKQGYVQKADVLLVDIHVTEVENQLQNAKSNIKNASDYVHHLIGETSEGILKPSDILNAELDLNLYNATFSNERSDIIAMEESSNAYNHMYKASKMGYVPRLNAFGSYEMYDKDIFQVNSGGYLVGAQLSWNVFEGYKRVGETQKTKAEFNKASINYDAYKSKSELEFNKAKRQLKDAENTLHLTNSAVEQANEALRIRTNRFEQGLEKSSDLLNSETQYLQKQLAYLQTVFNYNFTKAYVEFLTK
ncbi:Outer membrane protein TolC [Lutibacter agarilyticus]|uniref:Outer membrane protein TolC n=1 Tax=Lutibacter agarilyticus TaxID=1109740 RepID=A0A238YXD9_9FLAO|nr:TolC family protein [Lutibacter agarilyticus]SNR75421.1 Outer membrane protein TolC [Lutibacter agarilyticus]